MQYKTKLYVVNLNIIKYFITNKEHCRYHQKVFIIIMLFRNNFFKVNQSVVKINKIEENYFNTW